jgi:hypothetical protein
MIYLIQDYTGKVILGFNDGESSDEHQQEKKRISSDPLQRLREWNQREELRERNKREIPKPKTSNDPFRRHAKLIFNFNHFDSASDDSGSDD